jgi:hypothetical protein
MSRRDLIFLLNLIEFLFESETSPGSNEKIKPGEFRNALAAYLDINMSADSEKSKSIVSQTSNKTSSESDEKMKKQLLTLQEQVASLSSMTEMTINYMQESISRLEQENKKVANSVRFVERIIDSFVNTPSKIPFRQSYSETSQNSDFIIVSTTSKMGICYIVQIEKPFKDISKSIFALFINYLLEQIVISKRINNASSLVVELENQIHSIKEKFGNKEPAKLNIAVCIIEKQMGDLEYATNSFDMCLLNKGNFITFSSQEQPKEFSSDKYANERALLREGAEIFLIANEYKDLNIRDLYSKLSSDLDIDTKLTEAIRFHEQRQKSAAILAIKF